MSRQSSGPLRMLAPIGLVAFAVIFLILVVAALSGGSDGSDPTGSGNAVEQDASTEEEKTKKSYTVKPGDTLDAIAEKTGVAVEEIEALNPDLDPQALVAGSKLTLRSKSGSAEPEVAPEDETFLEPPAQ